MRRRTRIAASIAGALVLAPLLPLYPLRRMTRSLIVGGAGDQISYSWTIRSVFGLVDGFHYDAPEPLVIAVDLVVFALLVFTLGLLIDVVLRRLAGPGDSAH